MCCQKNNDFYPFKKFRGQFHSLELNLIAGSSIFFFSIWRWRDDIFVLLGSNLYLNYISIYLFFQQNFIFTLIFFVVSILNTFFQNNKHSSGQSFFVPWHFSSHFFDSQINCVKLRKIDRLRKLKSFFLWSRIESQYVFYSKVFYSAFFFISVWQRKLYY